MRKKLSLTKVTLYIMLLTVLCKWLPFDGGGGLAGFGGRKGASFMGFGGISGLTGFGGNGGTKTLSFGDSETEENGFLGTEDGTRGTIILIFIR